MLLVADGTVKFIDFEFASPGHPPLNAAYRRMTARSHKFECDPRSQVLLGGLALSLEAALQDDADWGISTRRSRIRYYLETAS